MANTSPSDSEPVRGEDARLISLRHNLEKAESELRDQGYIVERCVTPPGVRLSSQLFDQEILILLIFGSLVTQSNEEEVELAAGDRLRVPPGVPFSLQASGETPAYWLHALRTERDGDDKAIAKAGPAPTRL